MPRKTAVAPERTGDLRAASMRPRPDAAENRRRRKKEEPDDDASMRPRPDAAENRPEMPVEYMEGYDASMRPRPDAAENRCSGSSSERCVMLLQ